MSIAGAAGRGAVLPKPPSKRAVVPGVLGQFLCFRALGDFPAVIIAMSVAACFANAR